MLVDVVLLASCFFFKVSPFVFWWRCNASQPSHGLSLRTPWLYVGELLAREIGRLVAIEACDTSFLGMFLEWFQTVRIEGSDRIICIYIYIE